VPFELKRMSKYHQRNRDRATARWMPRMAAIREALAAGVSVKELAAKYGTSQQNMSTILRKYP
jgi:DNA-binding NarL/FixJ family response regulator